MPSHRTNSTKPRWRLCACGCGKSFRVTDRRRVYYNYACGNRERQRSYREKLRIGRVGGGRYGA